MNKAEFLLRSLAGHRWGADELFSSEAAARPEAAALLSAMTSILQRSSSVALAARCAFNPEPYKNLEPLKALELRVEQTHMCCASLWLWMCPRVHEAAALLSAVTSF